MSKRQQLFTAGPWPARVGNHPDVNPKYPGEERTFRIFPHIIVGKRGSTPDTFTINFSGHNGTLEECDANARLISKAPDMVELLLVLEQERGISALLRDRITELLDQALEKP